MVSRAWTICMLLCLSASVGFAEWPEWIDKEKIRAAYFGYNAATGDNLTDLARYREHLADLSRHGLNTAFVKWSSLQVDRPEEIAALDEYADWCEEAGLHFVPIVNYLGGGNDRRFVEQSGRHFVETDGTHYYNTPCPADPVFWDCVVTKRAQLVAEHSLTHQIDGFALDPEMYGGETTALPGVCVCEACFQEFLAYRGIKVHRPGDAHRASWLKEEGLYQDFGAWQLEQVEALARGTERAVHKLNPDLIIGVLLLDQLGGYYNAWARGLGTEEMPVIAFGESTYAWDGIPFMPSAREHFTRVGAHATVCPGLFFTQFFASEVSGRLFHMAQDSAGYWLFTTLSLMYPPEALADTGYRLTSSPRGYWRALRRANRELDRQARLGTRFRPRLQITYASPEEVLEGAGLLKAAQADLRPLFETGQEVRPDVEPTIWRSERAYDILVEAGAMISATLEGRQLGRYTDMPIYALIAPDGTVLARGRLPLGQPVPLEVEAPASGIYRLVMRSKTNVFGAAVQMPHAVVTGAEGFGWHVCQYSSRMYFYVPPQVEQFSVTVNTSGSPEHARLLVWDPDGEQVANVQSSGSKPTQAIAHLEPSPQQRGKVWSFQIVKPDIGMLEDAWLTWDDRLPPYVAESPEALLLPATPAQASVGRVE